MENTFPQNLPPHKFEIIMLQDLCNNDDAPPPPNPIHLLEVYVDYFIDMTNNIHCSHLQQLSRAMLHGTHAIFPPVLITGHNGHDLISESKLEKGEGTRSFVK